MTTEAKPDQVYIGVNPCGCVTFMMVPGMESERSERAELKRVIKSGRRIEMTTSEDARQRWTHCEHTTHVEDVDAHVDRLLSRVARPENWRHEEAQADNSPDARRARGLEPIRPAKCAR